MMFLKLDFIQFDPLVVALISTLLTLLWILFKKDEKASLINKLPGPTPIPFFGNLFEFLQSKEKILKDALNRRKKFGPIYRMWMGSHPLVILSRPEDIEVILKSSKHSEKSFGYEFLYDWLGTGLLTAYGHKWATHRKLITPTFHFSVLQSFVEVFEENAKILVGKMEKVAKEEKECNIYPLITLCALDIICETAMGTKVNAQLKSQSQYVQSVYKLSSLISKRTSSLWLHPDFTFKLSSTGREFKKHLDIVQELTKRIIQKRKQKITDNTDNKNNKKLAFLDLLLRESRSDSGFFLTDAELQEEVDTFMFEGHDTTAAAMNWTLFMLGHHLELQEEVYQEIKSVFEEKNEEYLTLADLTKLKLLERIIKETLRVFPSVTVIARKVEEDVQLGKFLIPKGTNAMINIYILHRDTKYYPNPEKFDPDRFLPENTIKLHPFAYLPFSAGPRNCIGQKFALIEEKVVLSTLIFNYKFQSVDKVEDVPKLPELILRPKFGIKMKIFKR